MIRLGRRALLRKHRHRRRLQSGDQLLAADIHDWRSFRTRGTLGVLDRSEMIIWGGLDNFGYRNSGGRYDPVADTWIATSTDGAPDVRSGHTSVFTDSG